MKDYFQGRYFKCTTPNQTIAFIPALHCRNHQKTASLQVITDEKAYNINFHASDYKETASAIKLGDNVFSNKGVRLNIQNSQIEARGTLSFDRSFPIRYDIMGPFHFVPFMQCRHSVYSIRHTINGKLILAGKQYIFQDGVGYTEGDRGHSFPERYIWTQSSFPEGALMLSVADIPLCGFHFIGIIGVILLNGKEYRLATYLGARLVEAGKNSVRIQQGKYSLFVKLLEQNALPLYAPEGGSMSRTIHESAACKAYYHFSYQGNTMCEFTSTRVSFEYEV